MIVNRLVLNLNHELNLHGRDRYETSLLENEFISTRILGNIGGPLKTEGYYVPNDDIRTFEFELHERRRTNRMSFDIDNEKSRPESSTLNRTSYKLLEHDQ